MARAQCAAVVVLFTTVYWTCSGAITVASASIERELAAARQALDQGRPDVAVKQLQPLLETIGKELPFQSTFDLLALIARAERGLGAYRRAVSHLSLLMARTPDDAPPRARALVRTWLADAWLRLGRIDRAEKLLAGAEAIARESKDSALLGSVLLNLGAAQSVVGDRVDARRTYAESLKLSTQAQDWGTAARAGINAARLSAEWPAPKADEQDLVSAELDPVALVRGALEHGQKIEHPGERAFVFLAAGKAALANLKAGWPSRSELALLAHEALREAAQIARKIPNSRLSSYALGYLGALYEFASERSSALEFTHAAALHAQTARANELHFEWQWQLGRLYAANGDRARALAAYRHSVRAREQMRGEAGLHPKRAGTQFDEGAGAVYFELADLLLRPPSGPESDIERQSRLRAARDVIERLKAAELEDYFQDDCVTALQSRIQFIENIDPSAAVIYPIPFPDRLELLVSVGDIFHQVKVDVTEARVIEQVRAMRYQIESVIARRYLRPAQQLYTWLVRPILPLLEAANVRTLVFVPQGELLSIPPAALHDGKNFLVERFPVATTPGLKLTDPQVLTRQNIETLLGGLSESRAGFSALPYVTRELESVRTTFNSTVFENRAFTRENLQDALAKVPYGIVHLATHAQFDADPKKSFILTYDGRLSLDGLEQLIAQSEFRDEPVELLTLSACETASGKHGSALGLAGIGVKAGARSVLATLWSVSDEATVLLMRTFYETLASRPDLSKAQVLRRAQLRVLGERRFRHAGYWGAFVLIGNWL